MNLWITLICNCPLFFYLKTERKHYLYCWVQLVSNTLITSVFLLEAYLIIKKDEET